MTGTLPVGNGGTGLSVLGTALQMLPGECGGDGAGIFLFSGLTGSLTSPRVPFCLGRFGAVGCQRKLTWDNTNKRLLIGTGTSAAFLNVFAGRAERYAGVYTGFGERERQHDQQPAEREQCQHGGECDRDDFSGRRGGGRPMIQFVVSAVGQTTIGVDNSDGDKFKITPGASVPGGTANRGLVVTNDATALVGVNKDAPAHPLDDGPGAGQPTRAGAGKSDGVVRAGAGTGASGSCLGALTVSRLRSRRALLRPRIAYFTVTLLTAFPAVHQFVPGARNPQAATDLNKFYTSGFSASQISVTSNGTLAASTQYVLYYVGIGY